jgi:hypothetical protein
MTTNPKVYTTSYLLRESNKVVNHFEYLEKMIFAFNERNMKIAPSDRSRLAYEDFLNMTEDKIQDIQLAYEDCEKINKNVDKIRSKLDFMLQTIETMNNHMNKKEISTLKNISGNIVKRDYDITDNDYIREILNNNETIEQNEKSNTKGGRRTKKLNSKNKSKRRKRSPKISKI